MIIYLNENGKHRPGDIIIDTVSSACDEYKCITYI